MTEKELFNKFYSLKPKEVKSFDDYSIPNLGKRKGKKYKLYSWIAKELLPETYLFNINRTLKRLGFTFQIYYDIVILGLTSIDQRPRCPYCGKLCKFYGGKYSFTCGDNDCINKSYRRIRGNESEEYRFNLFKCLVPLDFSNKNYCIVQKDSSGKTRYKYCLYSWITGDNIDRYVERPEKELLKLGFSIQIYYDVIVLGLKNISQRPKCIICGNKLPFRGLHKGYRVTCSKKCWRIYRLKYPENIKPTSEELKLKRSNNAVNYLLNSSKVKGNSGRYNSDIFNTTFYYDSSWELDFIKIMERVYKKGYIKSFSRNKDAIPYIKPDGSKHKYLPDFELITSNNKRVVIEIKPAGFLQKDEVVRLKRLAAQKFYWKRKTKYIIITENELYKNIHGSFWIYDYII